MLKRIKCHFYLGVLLIAIAASLYAQSERGNITGLATDPTGSVVPGADVVIKNISTGISQRTATTSGGQYGTPVVPGTYDIEIQADGFKRYLRSGVVVPTGTTVRVDAVLELGAVTETVEVSANAVAVQTEDATVQAQVSNRMIDQLPLFVGATVRSPYDLSDLTPETRRRSTSRSMIGGGQAAGWNATLDGISITDNKSVSDDEVTVNAPSVEAISEFAVVTNGFNAEFGQAAGGVVTFASKSGTNEFHGSVYEFWRNDVLDSRGFFDQEKPVFRQNNFGASIGGPIVKNRTFFYTTVEAFRNRLGAKRLSFGQPQDVILTVPLPEMLDGDFTRLVNRDNQVIPIYDPATTMPNASGTGFVRDQFENNIVPQSRFSGLTRQVLPYAAGVGPNVDAAGAALLSNNFFARDGSLISPTTKFSTKIDHIFNEKHRVSFFVNTTRASIEFGADGPVGLPVPLLSDRETFNEFEGYRATHDWTISPTSLNHFTFGINRKVTNSSSPAQGEDWGVCLQNAVDCTAMFPRIQFTEFSEWGGVYNATGGGARTWAVRDDFTHIRGRHTFKMGYIYQNQLQISRSAQDYAGRARFSLLGTSVPGDTSGQSGSSFASFLLGDALDVGTHTIANNQHLYPYHGFYFQDDWKITPNLTLNLGIRYEFTLAPRDVDDRYSDLDISLPNPAVNNFPGALVFAGYGEGRQNSRALIPTDYTTGIGPRLGLAYALGGRTTIRAGVGRSFNRLTLVNRGSGHSQGFDGQYIFQSEDQGVTPAVNWDDGIPSYILPPFIDPTFANNQNVHWFNGRDGSTLTETYNWTLSVQRQVTSSTVLEVAYNAAVGANLQSALLVPNQVPTATWNAFVDKLGFAQARTLFTSSITSPIAIENGISAPYPNFLDPTVQTSRTVAQALRPYPQYLNFDTGVLGGDRSGHSSYHAMVIALSRRPAEGLTMQWSYSLTKYISDSDEFSAFKGATDHYNRSLEKSIGQFDQTHGVKLSTIYDLPVGRGKRWLGNGGIASHIIGGWRLAAIMTYFSGKPVEISRNNPLPIFNSRVYPTITDYDNWRAPISGDGFDPAVDLFLSPEAFPAQPNDFGNSTRYNPKVRMFPEFNENVSLAKSFSFTEKIRLDLRLEAFNLFNRVRFNVGTTNVQNNALGRVTSQENTPRRMQIGAKIYF